MDDVTEQELVGPRWANIPEDLESAVERIKRLEWVLQDLSRSVEIAMQMNRPELMQGFIDQANAELENKIEQIHNDEASKPIKIIRVVDDVSDKDKDKEDAKV